MFGLFEIKRPTCKRCKQLMFLDSSSMFDDDWWCPNCKEKRKLEERLRKLERKIK